MTGKTKELKTNWDAFSDGLNMRFHGVIAIVLAPFAYAFLETQGEFPAAPIVAHHFTYALITIILMGLTLLLAWRSRKQVIQATRMHREVPAALKAYQSSMVKPYLITAIAALIAVLGLYLTKHQFYTALVMLVLFIYSLYRPKYDRVLKETTLDEKVLTEWGKRPFGE